MNDKSAWGNFLDVDVTGYYQGHPCAFRWLDSMRGKSKFLTDVFRVVSANKNLTCIDVVGAGTVSWEPTECM